MLKADPLYAAPTKPKNTYANSMEPVRFHDLGNMPYKQAWEYQELLFDKLQQAKSQGQTTDKGVLLLVEHPHVFTLGKSGNLSNLLVNEQYLRDKGADFYRINRGGDITYHGPGQIVGYPIFNLDAFQMGVREYIFRLEEAVIECLKSWGVNAERLEGATGVWLDAKSETNARKICAIGVRASRGITMHGFAFNVNTDLSFYQWINPCGFTNRGVTSMARETAGTLSVEAVKTELLRCLGSQFGVQFISGT